MILHINNSLCQIYNRLARQDDTPIIGHVGVVFSVSARSSSLMYGVASSMVLRTVSNTSSAKVSG